MVAMLQIGEEQQLVLLSGNNTISFGSEYSFADYNVNQMMSHTFDSDKNKNYLMFRNLTKL